MNNIVTFIECFTFICTYGHYLIDIEQQCKEKAINGNNLSLSLLFTACHL